MTIRANKKISLVLSRLLDKYALGDTKSTNLQISLYDLTYDYKVSEDEVLDIFHNLKQHLLVTDWFEAGEDHVLFLDNNFLVNAETYLAKISEEADEKTDLNEDFKIEVLQGKIKLFYGKKSVVLADKLESKQAKLIQHLIDPYIGIVKTISSSSESVGVRVAVSEQRESIDGVFGEIQRKLSQVNFPIRLALDYKSQPDSVSLVKKLGKE